MMYKPNSNRHTPKRLSGMGKAKRIRALSVLVLCLTLLMNSIGIQAAAEEITSDKEADGKYTLDKVVVLSRHNIRSPLSGSGSLLGDITPHTWFQWTSQPSELSVRGAVYTSCSFPPQS